MSELRYSWDGQLLALRIKGMTNHELRCLILGLWRRLDKDDRADFISELNHYLDAPDDDLPLLSQSLAFADAEGGE